VSLPDLIRNRGRHPILAAMRAEKGDKNKKMDSNPSK
jgi:hypothetical protein